LRFGGCYGKAFLVLIEEKSIREVVYVKKGGDNILSEFKVKINKMSSKIAPGNKIDQKHFFSVNQKFSRKISFKKTKTVLSPLFINFYQAFLTL